VHAAANALKVAPSELVGRVEALIEERRRLERDLGEARRQLAMGGGGQQKMGEVQEVGGVKYWPMLVDGLAASDLNVLIDQGKQKLKSGIVAVANTTAEGTANLVVSVSSDLTHKFDAGFLVKAGAAVVGGQGGGRKEMARGGGPDGTKAGEALIEIQKRVEAA
jgi:alanyl-tRNA synthetase